MGQERESETSLQALIMFIHQASKSKSMQYGFKAPMQSIVLTQCNLYQVREGDHSRSRVKCSFGLCLSIIADHKDTGIFYSSTTLQRLISIL